MEINYQETSKDLLTRIDIHEKYGSANIDVWTNELLQPQPGMKILVVGCGAGKLSFLFDDYTKGGAQIIGGDFSEELLDKARAKNKERGSKIEFQFLDFNKPLAIYDHQMKTARAMEAAGGDIVLPQADLTGSKLSESVSAILLNPQRLQAMSAKSREMRRIDAGEVIVRECYALMGVTHDIDRSVGAAGA